MDVEWVCGRGCVCRILYIEMQRANVMCIVWIRKPHRAGVGYVHNI